MALTGIEIFKHLPKTNCKECGFPTCLAFAMKLAAKQATLEDCPHASDEAKEFLGAASAPPVGKVVIGTGDAAWTLGEETVLFRHEKKFVNPSAYTIKIADNDPELEAKVKAIADFKVDRVGVDYGVNLIAVTDASGDGATFSAAVQKVAAAAPRLGIVLASQNADVLAAGLSAADGKKPLVYGATADNVDQLLPLVKDKAALVVRSGDLNELSAMAEKAVGAGVKELILDPMPGNAREALERFTIIRRLAVKKNYKPFGYPILMDAGNEDPQLEGALATLGTMKYASVILLDTLEAWQMLGLLTGRLNIYTDPQKPMQVDQKVYEIGGVNGDSPLIVTTNFALTYFIVAGEIENSKVPTRLAVQDVEGLSVLTAWAAGKFTASKIAEFIKESGVEGKLNKKEVILPGYVAVLSGALEDKLGGDWKVVVGPREANQLPQFLKSCAKG
jgi:acetyl-CoA decarbonylase/synthase complex subunit gamma